MERERERARHDTRDSFNYTNFLEEPRTKELILPISKFERTFFSSFFFSLLLFPPCYHYARSNLSFPFLPLLSLLSFDFPSATAVPSLCVGESL